MAETATHDPRLERVDDTLVWRLGNRVVPLIAGAEDDAKDDVIERQRVGEGLGDQSNAGEGVGDQSNAGEGAGKNGEDGDLPPAVRAVLAKERRAAREAERRAKAAEARVADFEAANKTETEKLSDRATSAERERDEARQALLRERVARRLSVPDELVDRLRGTTEEDLETDAKSLLAAVKAPETERQTTAGRRPLRTGATPPAEADQDPDKAMGEQLLQILNQR